MSFPSTDLDIIVEVYLGADPTADPATWPIATDLSSRLMRRPITIRRGRGKSQKTLQSGSCTFWLKNTDGALTPRLATSVYYPDWDLGVPMRVSVDNVGPNPPYVRFAGFVADCKAVMVPGVGGINISAVQVTLGGVWRRISQGAVTKSALKRTILSSSPVAYWPLEDGDDATSGGSALSGGVPLSVASGVVDWAAATAPAGAVAAPDFSASGRLTAAISPTVAGPISLEFVAKVDESSFDQIIALQFSGGTFPWIFVYTQNSPSFPVQLVGWTNISSQTNLAQGAAVISDYATAWHHYRITLSQNGANIDNVLYLDGVASIVNSTAGALGLLTGVAVNPTLLSLEQTIAGSVAHVAIYNATLGEDHSDATEAYPGEQAHVRVGRLLAEEGIPYSGNAPLSNECGPQPVADVTEVLQDAEEVDHGMIVEDFAWGLNYRASSQRENLSPVITIDLATYRTTSGTQADVLTPVRNDQRLRNEWTISRPNGSSATAKDEASQAKRGRYNDADTVNVADDTRILDEAQWRVHEGTFDGLRYDTVPLDIAANL